MGPRRSPPSRRGVGTVSALTIASLALVGALGCASSRDPDSAQVQAAFERADPECELERTERISLGGLKLAAVKLLVRISDDEDSADMISNLRRVEVASYRVVTPPGCAGVGSLGDLGLQLVDLGWWPMVSERDGSESSWVFAHGDAEGDLDGLFVVTMGAGELEVVRLEGAIDRILADAVAEEPDRVAMLVDAAR